MAGLANAPVSTTDAQAKDILQKADTSGDGTLDQAEMDAYKTKMEDALKAPAQQAAGAAAFTLPSAPPSAQPSAPDRDSMAAGASAAVSDSSTTKVFDKLDTNKDGKVSFDEMTAGLAKEPISTTDAQAKDMFAKIDTSGDGSVDKTEFSEFRTKMEDAIKVQIQNAATYNQQGQANYAAIGNTVNMMA
jgi:Ca2+-binding EF-hand superfamily protein